MGSSRLFQEGGDGVFAGYSYLKQLAPEEIRGELVDIIGCLHNNAVQRVDRCSRAHGIMAHVPFLDAGGVEFALRIPADLKLHRGAGGVEKWILRRALGGLLPEDVLNREKAKFWECAGVHDVFSAHADQQIADTEFARERDLPDGSRLNTREALLYYRVFKEVFGDLDDLPFVGRTGSPPQVT